jgi:hypothetical protein
LDNEEVTALPNKLFAKAIETMALDQQVIQRQHQNKEMIKEWGRRWGLQNRENAW